MEESKQCPAPKNKQEKAEEPTHCVVEFDAVLRDQRLACLVRNTTLTNFKPHCPLRLAQDLIGLGQKERVGFGFGLLIFFFFFERKKQPISL